MKRLTCWIMAAVLCCVPFSKSQALTLPADEPVVAYYMPLTQLLFTVEYDEIVTEVGPFYQYSARYLGTMDVLTKSEKQFVLNKITFHPIASADTTRSYILQDKSGKAQLVSLSPYGTLTGYNIEPKTVNRKPKTGNERCKTGCDNLVGTETTRLMPLLEEQLMASSTAKMAEGAAKLIYRIREMRLNLLAGDVEKYPADGDALKRVLNEMDKREQELTAFLNSVVSRMGADALLTPREVTRDFLGLLNILHQNPGTSFETLMQDPAYAVKSAEKDPEQADEEDDLFKDFDI